MIPKFRAWVKPLNKMFNVRALDLLSTTFISLQTEEPLIYDEDNTILMQSTRVKDKNGIEIFEGDIVKCLINYWEYNYEIRNKEHIGQIVYNKGAWGIKCKTCGMIHSYLELPTWEIIGNIYENPELLKEKK